MVHVAMEGEVAKSLAENTPAEEGGDLVVEVALAVLQQVVSPGNLDELVGTKFSKTVLIGQLSTHPCLE
jgi:hypothetical protein